MTFLLHVLEFYNVCGRFLFAETIPYNIIAITLALAFNRNAFELITVLSVLFRFQLIISHGTTNKNYIAYINEYHAIHRQTLGEKQNRIASTVDSIKIHTMYELDCKCYILVLPIIQYTNHSVYMML